MKVGDLVEFKCISAGKLDNPPYCKDGTWRLGVVLGKKKLVFEAVNIFYKGQIVYALADNCRLVGDV